MSSLVDPHLIQLNLGSQSATEAILDLAGLVRSHPAISDSRRFESDLLAREALSSTYLGSGVAFPHAHSSGVSRFVLAIGRSDQGIDFGGAEPARLIFLLGSPQREGDSYLELMATLSRLVRDREVRERLLAEPSAEAFAERLLQAL